jgi:hypothetical protein
VKGARQYRLPLPVLGQRQKEIDPTAASMAVNINDQVWAKRTVHVVDLLNTSQPAVAASGCGIDDRLIDLRSQ